ncbi:MAG: epoxyqueuosine reductase QueH [Oscillospiraceae bacterium]|nr:epoxyqueuosine reductase QueH [Oscillospiraceae bacterium]
MNKKRLLLHACCAPCSTAVIERLIPDYEITLFWYNPNIVPEEEHIKRLSELGRYVGDIYPDIELIVGEYTPQKFDNCRDCVAHRLSETAKRAGGFDLFTTTLTVSPHKNANEINSIISEYDKGLQADFKKKNGYLRSIELSKKHNLYRQNYCGCKHES